MSEGLFSKMIQESKEIYEKRPEIKTQDVSMSDNPAFNLDYTKMQIINNIDNLDDKQLFNMLKASYPALLEDIFMKEDTSYLSVISSSRFLNVFIQVASSVRLNHTQKIYCNKLAYDYMTSGMHDDYIIQLFMNLSKTINREIIPALLALGLTDYTASYLALSASSHTVDDVTIRRVNNIIISSDLDIMSTQMIYDIYARLQFRATLIFRTMMYDTYTKEELHNISANASEIYANISLAALIIIENMPSNDIRTVLIDFVSHYGVSERTNEARFSIKSIAIADYERILQTVDYLEKVEMIIVP